MNLNAFLFGVDFFVLCLAQIIVYVAIAKLIRVRTTEFAVYTMFSKALVSKIISGTKYSLGCLPFAAGITVLGSDQDEYDKLSEEDKGVSLLNKPYGKRLLFQSGPLLAAILVFIVLFICMNISVTEFSGYFSNVFKAITGSIPKEDVELLTKSIIQKNGMISYAFLMLISFSALSYAFNFLSLVLSDPKIFSGTSKYVLMIFNLMGLIVIAYLFFWKIPVFLGHYFSVSEMIIAVLNYMAGALIAGIAGYFFVVSLVKLAKK